MAGLYRKTFPVAKPIDKFDLGFLNLSSPVLLAGTQYILEPLEVHEPYSHTDNNDYGTYRWVHYPNPYADTYPKNTFDQATHRRCLPRWQQEWAQSARGELMLRLLLSYSKLVCPRGAHVMQAWTRLNKPAGGALDLNLRVIQKSIVKRERGVGPALFH